MEIYGENKSDLSLLTRNSLKPADTASCVMWLQLIIMWPRFHLHTQMLENILNLIRLVNSSFFLQRRLVRVSHVNISKEQEVALSVAHATLTCWNATSMLFAAALGTANVPFLISGPQKASLCACKCGLKRERETSAVHTVKISIFHKSEKNCGVCADVSYF